MAAHNRFTNITQHVVIENATLGASNQNCRAFIGHRTAPIFKALKTNAIEYRLKISDLLG
ncbi:hypothetical protein [Agrobacterium rosae]|uniref:Uncharacterized protein n=1 Tax=Agrobacterium rosae TaxID=1972867 RepID=A0AAW9FBG7_9HYPH|nr:hypothetical protein [Agrobacterium rosae]MDX8301797.1 hypothetical protein [Agrobacterium rosae]